MHVMEKFQQHRRIFVLAGPLKNRNPPAQAGLYSANIPTSDRVRKLFVEQNVVDPNEHVLVLKIPILQVQFLEVLNFQRRRRVLRC